jgi:iron(II)-dependent oxidoreductase
MLAQNKVAHSRALKLELAKARAGTDALFRLISPEALYSRPIAERHRLIFYLGHLDAFDWNVMARRVMGAPAFHPEFDKLFERGIDPVPGEEPSDSPGDWPRYDEVSAYTLKIREWLDSHLDDFDPWVLQMVTEHRHMHAETLAYLFHNLPYDQKRGALPEVTSGAAPANQMLRIPAGDMVFGQTAGKFGWDNEFAAHSLTVPKFAVSRFKVSNAEYMEFVQQGGEVPNFWKRDGEKWFWRAMFGLVPLPPDWPVWVTWEQANAYAKWRGLALPSEAQWQRAASLSTPDADRDNFDFRRWDPVSVSAGELGARAPEQMTGNGWEWTRDLFAPFHGFEADLLYPAYSADFFDGEHYVLKGASPRTGRLLTRHSFRNWFRPEYQYMYAGFRLVNGAE